MEKELTKKEALELIRKYRKEGVSKRTLYDWNLKYNLGEKIVGRWKFDRQKLINLLEGKYGKEKNS